MCGYSFQFKNSGRTNKIFIAAIWIVVLFSISMPIFAGTQSAEESKSNYIISGLLGAVIGALIGGYFSTRVAKIAQKTQFDLLIKKEQLERVNDQLNNFYGPLYAISKASKDLWEKFCKEKGRCEDYDKFFIKKTDGNNDPAEEQLLQDYMRVMKEVFTPLNKQRMDIILTGASLIEENEPIRCKRIKCKLFSKILNQCVCVKEYSQSGNEEDTGFPQELIDLVAHVGELNAVMRRWDDKGYKFNPKAFILNKGENDCDYSNFYPSCRFPENLDVYLAEKLTSLKSKKRDLEKRINSLNL